MPRGRPRSSRPVPGEAVPLDPPASLVGRAARAAYRKLAADLRQHGNARSVDVEAVALAASCMARLHTLRVEADKLTEITVTTAKGTIAIHPVFGEQRREESRLQSILDRLYLTPRSRQAKTAKDELSRLQSQAQAEADQDALRLLG